MCERLKNFHVALKREIADREKERKGIELRNEDFHRDCRPCNTENEIRKQEK